MKHVRFRTIVSAAAVALVVAVPAGCTKSSSLAQAAGPIDVFVSIPPQAHFVERIGGSHVSVHVLVPGGREPHLYAPTQSEIMELGKARIYFAVGLPFEERLLAKVGDTHRRLLIVDTTAGITKISTHGHHDNHDGADPHVWLGPPEIAVQARNIANALKETDPARANAYEQGLAGFLGELDALNEKIAGTLAPYRGRKFYVFHPAFGYFARAYGLEQVAISPEGKPPSPKELEAVIRQARADNARVIFVHSQFDPSAAQKVADAIGASVSPLDPLKKDVLANLSHIAYEIERGSHLKF